MKKIHLLILTALPAILSAHPGHPGSADHAELTHALLGLLLALPVLASVCIILRARNKRRAALQAVRKENRHG